MKPAIDSKAWRGLFGGADILDRVYLSVLALYDG